MKESAFWNKIKRDSAAGIVPGYWQRVEVLLPDGFPDTVVYCAPKTYFVELKAVQKLNELRYELRPEQAVWNYNWRKHGGDAYIYAWVGEFNRALWFADGMAIRKGVFDEIPCPIVRGRTNNHPAVRGH